ncbi:hypothetical protein GCM10009718_11070 [Isoptericola halotolerans]|uniref:Uncharacterized protein n=1 Tax=Isoptericola halotolerans TaxID=300560 RepID=A0ABX2A2I7_9MICO|nr:hypothetical protein [Isoptericola halotolerans]NOV95972.1 hypothetical protein [Isoptericola halotolerans]
MGLFRRRPGDDRTWGMRFTESFLPIFGPANIRRGPAVPPSAEDQAREARLRQTFERVTGPDGHSYVVERQGERPTHDEQGLSPRRAEPLDPPPDQQER